MGQVGGPCLNGHSRRVRRCGSDNVKFDYTLDFERTNFRDHPELYRVGRGEQGVLLVEPYKGEILPHWRFKTPAAARASAARIYKRYEAYRTVRDFVGMDMARKYLQMGWTRSMRYANRRSGKKYLGPVPPDKRGRSGAHGREVAPKEPDAMKLESANIFERGSTPCSPTRPIWRCAKSTSGATRPRLALPENLPPGSDAGKLLEVPDQAGVAVPGASGQTPSHGLSSPAWMNVSPSRLPAAGGPTAG